MNGYGWVTLVVVAIVFYFIGAKFPGVAAKVMGG